MLPADKLGRSHGRSRQGLALPALGVLLVAAACWLGLAWLASGAAPLATVGAGVGCVATAWLAARAVRIRAEERIGESADRVLAYVCHDMRAILHGLQGQLELLADAPLADAEHRRVALAQRAAKSLRALVERHLDRSAALDAEAAFDLRQALDEVIAWVQPLARENRVELCTDWPPQESLPVSGDVGSLQRIVQNLVSNAVKFSPDGRVRVSARRLARLPDGTRFRIDVEDNGRGMAPESVERVFSPGAQLGKPPPRVPRGFGLGLCIVRELADTLGAEIAVESERGVGSRFSLEVRLQERDDPATEQSALPAQRADESHFGLSVLVADDDPVSRDLAASQLAHLGCQAETVSDGRTAFERVVHDPPDLVLLDEQMPEIDGSVVIRRLRDALGDRCPFLVSATGVASASGSASWRETAADARLEKPYDRDALCRVLARAKARRPAANGQPDESSLDPSVWEAIAGLDPTGRNDTLARAFRSYLGAAPGLLETLEEAASEEDPEALMRAAHRLRSSSAQVGARRLASLAERLEKLGRRGETKGAETLTRAFSVEYAHVSGALRARLTEASRG
ncbi:MAG: ATP-binding protein [Proteobacteria bacterium]|nr:ATP-binding protein [Pseudomonadota bacterium]